MAFGLGLFIVRQITDAHGGKVHGEREGARGSSSSATRAGRRRRSEMPKRIPIVEDYDFGVLLAELLETSGP